MVVVAEVVVERVASRLTKYEVVDACSPFLNQIGVVVELTVVL